jgi:hypothetical protein
VIEQLTQFFTDRIETKRHHVPKIVLRIQEKARSQGKVIKTVKRGLSVKQEALFLSVLNETLVNCFEFREEVILWADYEPQGILRKIAENSNLSPREFAHQTMLPSKLHIRITRQSIVIKDDGVTMHSNLNEG